MEIVRKIKSLCPICLKVIDADLKKEDGKIYIEKNCSEDGSFKDIYFSDSDLYDEFMRYFQNGNQNNTKESQCPSNCGLCDNHKSSSVLANIDITNLCNYSCPICFANAKTSGYTINPSIEKISKMMDKLREQDYPCSVLQFSGGEPTIRKDLFEISKLAHDKGFIQIQIATNGKIISENEDYPGKLRRAHVDTIYLQFDGVTPEPYIKTRGFNAFPEKIKAIENLRKNGKIPNAVLVPTLVKGINDDQVGDIVRFALKNIDVVRGINFQPVAFTGRINNSDLLEKRITIPDLISLLEKQLPGQISKEDFFPLPIFMPLFDYLRSKNKNTKYPQLNTHPICGVWTYLFKDGDKLIPLNRIINIEAVFSLIRNLESTTKTQAVIEVSKKLLTLVRFKALKNSKKIISLLLDIIFKGGYKAFADFHDSNVLFIGSMHFMDPYNFDCERVERCCVHYATLDERIIPFCAYNNLYRKEIESEYLKEHNGHGKKHPQVT